MHIGIFTIIKNEHEYLEEWLQYHLTTFPELSKIYVFDDPFSKPHKEICDKYNKVINTSLLSIYPEDEQESIRKGTFYGKLDRPRQIAFMYDILNYLKKDNFLDWVFYIDVDEFITLADGTKPPLSKILNSYSMKEILVLSWKNYGANGYLTKPEGSVIENYTKECPLYVGLNMASKSSSKLCFNLRKWNPDTVFTNHHIPIRARWCKTNFSINPADVVYDKIYIRHYITKSLDEFCRKIFIRGQFLGSKHLRDFFSFNKDIKMNNPDVQEILNKYRDMFYSGKIWFSIW